MAVYVCKDKLARQLWAARHSTINRLSGGQLSYHIES